MNVEGDARRVTLPLDSASVPRARSFLRDSLRDASAAWDADTLHDAALLVSEVVTNALLHAGTSIEVTVSCDDMVLRVEVADGSPTYPVVRDHPTLAGTGRGLHLLDELAARWGIDPHEDGKVVWFELHATGFTPALPELSGAHDLVAKLTAGDSVKVTLKNVPLLLHAAWQVHAEAVLREHMLATLTMDEVSEQLETHAAAHAAMTLLLDQVPLPDLGIEPEELMAAATEPNVSQASLTLHLDAQCIHDFHLLNWALSQAWDMAQAGKLLTPPMQPELWMLRQWICGEVVGQSTGDAPRPWSLDSTALIPPTSPPVTWDTRTVTESQTALVAADDTNAVVAVSRPALQLLGYDSPDTLIGRRLVTIIPARYHQAHLAGFSMHLSVDRSPLLGRTVTVPALRRDGSEVMVDLTVTPHLTVEGRTMFLGELVPKA